MRYLQQLTKVLEIEAAAGFTAGSGASVLLDAGVDGERRDDRRGKDSERYARCGGLLDLSSRHGVQKRVEGGGQAKGPEIFGAFCLSSKASSFTGCPLTGR